MPEEGSEEAQARAWWNARSETFQSEGGHAIAIAFGPGAPEGDDLGLLGDVAGVDAVELGCGGAQCGIALARQGANVTGVDVSQERLAHARTLAGEHGVDIEFIRSSVTDLSSVPDGAFELAFSAFAFQWVSDLRACFSEAYRILADGGRLVFSIDHPYWTRRSGNSQGATSATILVVSPVKRLTPKWSYTGDCKRDRQHTHRSWLPD